MPGDIAGTREVMRFIATQISPNTYINLMDQYHPAFKSARYPEVHRLPTEEEYRQAYDTALEEGIERLDGRAPRRRVLGF
jgi:putative pyruvate formate lyase activating enzyme